MKEETGHLEIKDPKDVAAGFPAIASTMFNIWRETYVGRGIKTLFRLNQVQGYDCPSCAWPDPDPEDRSPIAEYCESGAKAVASEATKYKADPVFFAKYTIEELRTQSNYWLELQGRIVQPMVKWPGATHYTPISWYDAFQEIGKQLRSLAHPDEAIFYTSGRASNESAFMYQLFARQFGTNNLPDCSNMCHEPTSFALKRVTGIGKASVTINDIQYADLMIIMGQNPGTNAPRMLTELQKLKKNGGKIIAVNPLQETGLRNFEHPQKPWEWLGLSTSIEDVYVPVRINGDLAYLKAILKVLVEEEKMGKEIFDRTFIEQKTTGAQELFESLEKYTLDELVEASGVSQDLIIQSAILVRDAQRIIIAWAMGITQHQNSENTIQEIVNVLLLKGSIGKTGAGTLPVRGHSNVQGDRTVGVWEQMPDSFLDSLGKTFNFEPPREHGVASVDAVKHLSGGRAKAFIGLGGNFVQATPDTELCKSGMRQCKLTVQISTKLNQSHLHGGDTAFILPCLGRTEIDQSSRGRQFISMEDTAGRVRMSLGDLDPVSPYLKSEVAIICRMAEATLQHDTTVAWDLYEEDYDLIRAAIESTVDGFDAYNERVRQAGGFYLPNKARMGEFDTDAGKGMITVNPLPQRSTKEGRFTLMTLRSHDQFNTTIYGMDDRYRGIYNARDIVMMNPEDMELLGLVAKDVIKLTSYFKNQSKELSGLQVVPYEIPTGCLAMYFPEGNALMFLDNKAEHSECPASKFMEVSVEKTGLSSYPVRDMEIREEVEVL